MEICKITIFHGAFSAKNFPTFAVSNIHLTQSEYFNSTLADGCLVVGVRKHMRADQLSARQHGLGGVQHRARAAAMGNRAGPHQRVPFAHVRATSGGGY